MMEKSRMNETKLTEIGAIIGVGTEIGFRASRWTVTTVGTTEFGAESGSRARCRMVTKIGTKVRRQVGAKIGFGTS